MENVILSPCLISHHARIAYEGVEYGSTYIYPRHYMEAKVSRQPLNKWLGGGGGFPEAVWTLCGSEKMSSSPGI